MSRKVRETGEMESTEGEKTCSRMVYQGREALAPS